MKTIEKAEKSTSQSFVGDQRTRSWLLLFYVGALLCCFALFGFAAQRVMKPLTHYTLPFSAGFRRLGSWLPTMFYPASDAPTSLQATSYIEMFLFLLLAFVVYGMAAVLVWHSMGMTSNSALARSTPPRSDNPLRLSRWIGFSSGMEDDNYKGLSLRGVGQGERAISLLIWLGAIGVGLLLVSTPVLLSQDVFVYGDYGHILVAYGANPFFVAPAAISHDSITTVDNWGFATSAYGPIWMYICALVALVGGDHPGRYYIIFRLLAFACYLLNVALVSNILRVAGCSLRMRALGALLYAWNPLVLLESCLGAHNDVLVETFLLLAVFLALRIERENFLRPRHYYGPLLACGLAVLVKFTVLPLLALFLLLLLRKTLERQEGSQWIRWRAALGNVCLAGLLFVSIALVCYLPLWLGHSMPEIAKSFSTPPSALWAENSFLRTIQDGLKVHGYPAPTSPFYGPVSLLSQRAVWDRISASVLACMLLVGAVSLWRAPTIQRLVLASLASLSVLLIVTPWFYPWYVQWIVALAVLLLMGPVQRLEKALLAFVLVFSATALLTYLDPVFTPLGRSLDTRVLFTTGIPVLVAFVLFWRARDSKHQKI